MEIIVALLTAISLMTALGLIIGFMIVLTLKTPTPCKLQRTEK